MPSPFPGMDPYFENPIGWGNTHHGLISAIRDQLVPVLRPKYAALVEDRVYLADPADVLEDVRPPRFRVPDVKIITQPARGEPPPEAEGGVAVATATDVETEAGADVAEPITVFTGPLDVTEHYLEIREVGTSQVVAIIEVLSPTNKRPGSEGLRVFQERRQEVLRSPVHWIEIDLLRAGESLPARKKMRLACEYLIHVSVAPHRPAGRVWPIRLSQRLPVIPVPLKPEDPDAPLDLQAVLTAAYDRGGYDYQIDYKADPVPPLEPPWTEWADRLLKEKGLR